jgi:signal peptidase II
MASAGCSNQRGRVIGPLFGSALIAALDQAVKLAVVALRPLVPVIPRVFDLRFATNTGAAFSLLQGFPLGVTLLSAVILVAILIYFARMAQVLSPLERIGLALLLGGATGNLIDRVRLGYVVDYLDLYAGPYHWPTFNLADSAISIGVACLAFASFRRGGDASGRPHVPASSRAQNP